MPMNKALYPADWAAISRRIRDRAGQRCEWCQVPNGEYGARDRYGQWHSEDEIDGMNSTEGYMLFGDYPKIIKIVLTVAHLDHDTASNEDSNLAALCCQCHNRYDAPMRAKHAAVTRSRKRHAAIVETGQGVLFEEEL